MKEFNTTTPGDRRLGAARQPVVPRLPSRSPRAGGGSMMRRLVNALLAGVFMVAAVVEEFAERVANWADELLIERESGR